MLVGWLVRSFVTLVNCDFSSRSKSPHLTKFAVPNFSVNFSEVKFKVAGQNVPPYRTENLRP